MKIEFYKHQLGSKALSAISSVINSPFLTYGPVTKNFEEFACNYLNTKHFSATSSCTSAMFLILKAWGVGPGDEVIIPSMTFIATANIVLHCGAKPVFCDVDAETALLNNETLSKVVNKKTKAIIAVNLYGALCDIENIKQNNPNILILEDCAHCFEGIFNGNRPGKFSDAAAFSFYATKNLTSGEGGGIAMNSEVLFEKLYLLRQHGMSKSAADRYSGRYQHWDMLELGYKENMFDIQAAMLLSQIDEIDIKRERREMICQYYEENFKKNSIKFPIIKDGTVSARHLMTIWANEDKRDKVISELTNEGIGVAVNYRAVHQTTFYKNMFGDLSIDLPNSTKIGNQTLTLPLYPNLTDTEVEYIVDKTLKVFKNLNAY
jgi:dTDP-4-amino-4,6-dideoxygalactose transaminase